VQLDLFKKFKPFKSFDLFSGSPELIPGKYFRKDLSLRETV